MTTNPKYTSESERQKYNYVHQKAYGYQKGSMGKTYGMDTFVKVCPPPASVIDLGAGNGLATAELQARGYTVGVVEIADDALVFKHKDLRHVPKLRACLWEDRTGWPLYGGVGFCTDVMEHIPEAYVDDALDNISGHCRAGAFFQICFSPDGSGPSLGIGHLHLTVRPKEWWEAKLSAYFQDVRHLPGTAQGMFWCTQ